MDPTAASQPGFFRRFGIAHRIAALRAAVVDPTDPASSKAAAALLRLARREPLTEDGPARAAMIALLARWRFVPAAIRQSVLGLSRAHWPVLLDALQTDPDPEARRAVLHVLDASPDPVLLARVPALLLDSDPSVADAAAASLAAMLDPVQSLTEPMRTAAIESLAVAAAGFADHRRPAVVEWLARLGADPIHGQPDTPIGRVLADDSQGVVGELRTWIRRADHPGSRLAAMQLARHATLGRACQSRLAERDEAAEHEAVLARSSLAFHPERLKALARPNPRGGSSAGPPRFLGLDAHSAAALSEPARLALVRMLSIVSTGEASSRLVAAFAADRSAMVRHRLATSEVVGREALDSARLDLCFDPNEHVARSAAIASLDDLRPGGPGWGLDRAWSRRAVESLARSPHASVRVIGRAALARLDPRRVDDPSSRLAARRRLRVDRESVLAELRVELMGLHAAAVLRAMEMVRVLELESALEERIVPLAGAADETLCREARVVATAVRLLGRLTSPASAELLRTCLHSDDQRTRANAVEALSRRSRSTPALPAVLVELKDDPHHRVRATAIHGLMHATAAAAEPVSAPSLGSMLGDDRPMHRVAGLWLAERTTSPGFWRRWGDLAGRVATLAVNDPEPAVRDRAARCAGAIAARIRIGWTRSS